MQRCSYHEQNSELFCSSFRSGFTNDYWDRCSVLLPSCVAAHWSWTPVCQLEKATHPEGHTANPLSWSSGRIKFGLVWKMFHSFASKPFCHWTDLCLSVFTAYSLSVYMYTHVSINIYTKHMCCINTHSAADFDYCAILFCLKLQLISESGEKVSL